MKRLAAAVLTAAVLSGLLAGCESIREATIALDDIAQSTHNALSEFIPVEPNDTDPDIDPTSLVGLWEFTGGVMAFEGGSDNSYFLSISGNDATLTAVDNPLELTIRLKRS